MNWVLVTGGAKRLGAEICRKMASEGLPVVVHYNTSSSEALEVVKECRTLGTQAEAIQGDFSSRASTEDFIVRYLEKFSNTGALINNVGNYLIQSALKTSCQQWEDLFQTNFHAPRAITCALIPSLKRSLGSVINIGSTGLLDARPNTYSTAYFLSKSLLWGFTKSLAKEIASDGVRVNMVSPGHLDISVDLPKDITTLPMKRAATSQEVARVIAFLLEKKSEYITGQNIEVAGAYCL